MPKVYLSPAMHRQNECCYPRPDGKQCYEALENNEYIDILEPILNRCGIETKRGYRRTPMNGEDGDVIMRQNVAESDAWGADVHYVSHTNASTDGTAQGCRPIYYAYSKNGKKLGEIMARYRKEIYPRTVTLNARSDLYELRVPSAVSFYEEHAFHDNLEDITWFHEHMTEIAESAAKGLCEYFSIPYVEPDEQGGESSPAAADKLVAIALGEVGYLEKATNAQLDDKTANAGSNNFTKYARDIDAIPHFFNGAKQGYAWCTTFVCWCFIQAFGVEETRRLLNLPLDSLAAGCVYAIQYYKAAGRLYTTPQVGDQVFFGTAHTGIVVAVNGSSFDTVEGNTSGASGVISNGGGVCRKSYTLQPSYTFGRPNWAEVEPEPEKPAEPVTPEQPDVTEECTVRVTRSADGKSGTWELVK